MTTNTDMYLVHVRVGCFQPTAPHVYVQYSIIEL